MVVQVIIGLVFLYLTYRGIRRVSNHITSVVQERTDGDLFQYLKGNYLDCSKAKVLFNWKEPAEVGSTVSFKVKFYYCNMAPYSIRKEDQIITQISVGTSQNIPFVEEYVTDGEDGADVDCLQVSFTVRVSATYYISLQRNGVHLAGSPFKKIFQPGPLSPAHTRLVRCGHVATTSLTVTQGQNHVIKIDARDEYNNDCSACLRKKDFDEAFKFRLYRTMNPDLAVAYVWEIANNKGNKRLEFELTVFENGYFKALLDYRDQPLKHGSFSVISLTDNEAAEVKTNMSKRNLYYECRLLRRESPQDIKTANTCNDTIQQQHHDGSNHLPWKSGNTDGSKYRKTSSISKNHKKVYCYITPRQLIIKEYLMLLIPIRIASFRVSPSTEICLEANNEEVMTINDGTQPQIILSCPRRNVLLATFHSILYGNAGCSNSFEEKVENFYKELLAHHQINNNDIRNRPKTYLKISRADLLNTTMQATRSFSSADWRKYFQITFKGEEGIDWGGLNKEWIFLLCQELFSCRTDEGELFQRFKSDPQALTLPAPTSQSGMKLKHFDLAGKLVGKCLFESALGGQHKRQVSARFARSFLAQLIGMPVSYAHFESDDPSLYTSKILYTLKSDDVEDLEMTFTEEVYQKHSNVPKIHELMYNGSKTLVTNNNKKRYLNLMAQFRLCTSIKPEIDAFVKGLTSIVPDHLLSVFDENELELVMCGSSEVSAEDMKKHCITSYEDPYFNKTLEWFWAVTASFTPDELARLVQFTTGCSQLPPDGFKALEPPLKITSCLWHHGQLPTAHTCFNELVLPMYDSCEHLSRMLKIAITEGVSGFGRA